MFGKDKGLHVTALPVERTGFVPVGFVHTIIYRTLTQRTVSGIQTRQVFKLVELVHTVQIHNQIEWNGLGTPLRMPCIPFIKIKEFVHFLTSLVRTSRFARNTPDGKFQRVGLRGGSDSCPVGHTRSIHRTHLKCTGRFRTEVLKQQSGIPDGTIQHTVVLYLIIIGMVHLLPGRSQRVSPGILFRDLWFRSGQCPLADSQFFCWSKHITFHFQRHFIPCHIHCRQLDVHHRILHHLHTGHLTARSGKTVQLRSGFIIIYIFSLLQCLQRRHRSQFHFLPSDICRQFLRLCRHIEAEISSLFRHHSFKMTLRRCHADFQVFPFQH